ncbi:MAG: phosphatidylserine/phosphatidylglycerophosphate/cardiolipin synthase family protein [Rhodobacteraceae bacterium]|nr:phosphatidylserine/phosphatidylglycerophosphate/cardiolipin synthase family protein [Paracoccaceae bacterium]
MMHDWVVWLALAVCVLGVGALVSLWAAGRFARLKRGKPSNVLPRADDETPLDRLLEPLERQDARLSGLRLVPAEAEALALRLAMARCAGRSLDLMYYIWEDDLTGRLLAGEVLAAADRGVRVRMLIDDVNMLQRDPAYRALDRHPRIEVRVFNPIRNRDKGILRGLELLFNLLPYNRRMHNKLMIADARLAITGGRNVGDPYFGVQKGSGVYFDDLDVLATGAVLGSMGSLFDRFWNSGAALPIRTLWIGKSTRLRRFRQRLARFLDQPDNRARLARLDLPSASDDGLSVLGIGRLHWIDGVEFLADPPEKSLGARREGWLPESLMPLLRSAERELRIMTPYFVPGRQGMAQLIALARAGVSIEIITNGLGRSDSMLVYGAYRWYRPQLLDAGIRLVEAAHPDEPDTMMHAKSFIVDGSRAFVGSFNFDLRSAFLNTEVGVTFDDPALIEELTAIFDAACAPRRGWRVSRHGRLLRWTRGEESTRLEPGTNAWKRLLTFCIGHLPIHRFL